jgi:hypothetical protein
VLPVSRKERFLNRRQAIDYITIRHIYELSQYISESIDKHAIII